MLPEESSSPSRAVAAPLSGKALLVDDEEVVRTVASDMLRHLGFEVLVAEDGIEALSVFKQHAADIRLVLLDMTMPRMGGEEAMHEIHKIDPNACVVLSSGFSGDSTVRLTGPSRPAGFVQKPYELQFLRSRIVEALSNAQVKAG
jgi:CheY-like chemotaxis protein